MISVDNKEQKLFECLVSECCVSMLVSVMPGVRGCFGRHFLVSCSLMDSLSGNSAAR